MTFELIRKLRVGVCIQQICRKHKRTSCAHVHVRGRRKQAMSNKQHSNTAHPCIYMYVQISLYPQVFDNYAVTVMIGGEPYTLGLFDTAGKIASLSPPPLSLGPVYSILLCNTHTEILVSQCSQLAKESHKTFKSCNHCLATRCLE